MATCDIVIPAFNSAQVLPRSLAALASQAVPAGWQVGVIVIDDGSDDATALAVRTATKNFPWPARVIKRPHGGVASARNTGLDNSQADIIFFLSADIVLSAGSLAAHLDWHSRYPQPDRAALGFVVWDPLLQPSSLMEWLTHGGPQNNFDDLLGESEADPAHFFYGSNISLKRASVGSDRFAEDFKSYGWEDLEFGRRLGRRGLRLDVLPDAFGWHAHYYQPETVWRRQLLVGRNLVAYQRLHPEVKLLPDAKKSRRVKVFLVKYSGLLYVLSLMVRWMANISFPRIYSVLTATYFWLGVEDKQ